MERSDQDPIAGDLPEPGPEPRLVGLLVPDNASLLNIAGPAEVFLMTERELARQPPVPRRPGPLRTVGISIGGGQVRTSVGIRIDTISLAEADGLAFDTIAVIGGVGAQELADSSAAIGWLAKHAKRTSRVAAFGSGALMLARAGLLEGKRCAVHWRVAEDVQREAPNAQVEANELFVQDGNLLTAAGSVASLDLALKMIEDDYGRRVAVTVAHLLMVGRVRSGEQPQFGAELQAQLAVTPRAQAAADWMVSNIDQRLTVAGVAEKFAMTERSLSRLFLKEIGVSPHKFIEQVRVENARRWLTSSNLPIEKIALRCGFSGSKHFNESFKRLMGRSPKAYRAHFADAR